jgi:hypothetical protein
VQGSGRVESLLLVSYFFLFFRKWQADPSKLAGTCASVAADPRERKQASVDPIFVVRH